MNRSLRVLAGLAAALLFLAGAGCCGLTKADMEVLGQWTTDEAYFVRLRVFGTGGDDQRMSGYAQLGDTVGAMRHVLLDEDEHVLSFLPPRKPTPTDALTVSLFLSDTSCHEPWMKAANASPDEQARYKEQRQHWKWKLPEQQKKYSEVNRTPNNPNGVAVRQM